MAVFTFVVKHSGGTWTAKQHGGEADLEASSASTWELQRKLTNLALTSAGSGTVSSSFSLITPSSAVAQVGRIRICTLHVTNSSWTLPIIVQDSRPDAQNLLT